MFCLLFVFILFCFLFCLFLCFFFKSPLRFRKKHYNFLTRCFWKNEWKKSSKHTELGYFVENKTYNESTYQLYFLMLLEINNYLLWLIVFSTFYFTFPRFNFTFHRCKVLFSEQLFFAFLTLSRFCCAFHRFKVKLRHSVWKVH